jgi:hypothetical protein
MIATSAPTLTRHCNLIGQLREILTVNAIQQHGLLSLAVKLRQQTKLHGRGDRRIE